MYKVDEKTKLNQIKTKGSETTTMKSTLTATGWMTASNLYVI